MRFDRVHTTATWVPLAVVVLLVAVSLVTGRSPVASAAGASSATVPVTGSNAAVISIDTTGCAPAAVSIGEILPGTDPWKTAQDNGGAVCAVQFGSTNVSQGVNLDVLEDPGAPASPAAAMKCTGGSCSGKALDDYSGGTEPAVGTSAFGAQLLGSGGGATRVWSSEPAVHAIGDAGDTACRTSAVGDGTCTFTFGASAAAADAPGAYEAQVRYVVLAR